MLALLFLLHYGVGFAYFIPANTEKDGFLFIYRHCHEYYGLSGSGKDNKAGILKQNWGLL